ncbi:MAG: threonine dehydratase, partial [Glaciecola sp.]
MISLEDVRQAAARIEGAATRTPIMTSRAIDSMLDATVLFKCENLQRGGAFKFRGAYNTIASMSVQQRAEGVFAFSSGNHAQAVALAA